jgi:DNA-binding response OmpR family regulator
VSNGDGADPKLKRILLLDHDEHARRIYAAILEHRGYEVSSHSSCQEAVSVAERREAHLILVDPFACDEDCLERLRRVARESGIPALALTGRVTEPELASLCSAGFDVVLIKPIPPNEVAEAVQAAMNGLDICSPFRQRG